jgi:hypothetical protein
MQETGLRWRWESFGILRRLVLYRLPDVSEALTVSIIRTMARPVISRKTAFILAAVRTWNLTVHRCFKLLPLLTFWVLCVCILVLKRFEISDHTSVARKIVCLVLVTSYCEILMLQQTYLRYFLMIAIDFCLFYRAEIRTSGLSVCNI